MYYVKLVTSGGVEAGPMKCKSLRDAMILSEILLNGGACTVSVTIGLIEEEDKE